MLKSPKQLPNSTEYSKKGVYRIVFKDVLYPCLCCDRFLLLAYHEPGSRKALLSP